MAFMAIQERNCRISDQNWDISGNILLKLHNYSSHHTLPHSIILLNWILLLLLLLLSIQFKGCKQGAQCDNSAWIFAWIYKFFNNTLNFATWKWRERLIAWEIPGIFKEKAWHFPKCILNFRSSCLIIISESK